MAVKKTPPMYARGRYVLTAPFDSLITATRLYTCIAIRSFKDVYEDGLDVEIEYYNPMGLVNGQDYGGSPFDFQAEKDALANIVTLIGDNGQMIFVPDTFIASYPDLTDVKYSQIVVAFNFGAVPDYLVLSAVKSGMANLGASHLGVVPAVTEHRAPSANAVTPIQHEALEVARLGAISNQETDYAKWKRMEQKIIQLQDTIDKQTAILEENGWLPV